MAFVEDMAKNTENPKFCKEGVRTSSETFKNEFSTLKMGRGEVLTSQHVNLLPHTARGQFWGRTHRCHAGIPAPMQRAPKIENCRNIWKDHSPKPPKMDSPTSKWGSVWTPHKQLEKAGPVTSLGQFRPL